MTTDHSLPGGYSFFREIGRGAFARIYEGRSTAGERVAIKVLNNPTPMAKKRFKREVRVLKALPPNRHIVGFVDSGTTEDGTPFLVLELLEGTTLAHILASGRRFSENAAAALMLQLCDAFTELHRLGVTHGDIKPTNIMLTTDSTGDATTIVAKLLDFGLVRDTQGLLRLFEDWDMMDGADFQEDLDSGIVAGTAEYIAPEIVTDAQNKNPNQIQTDTPSDVFGLGVILYVLITGRSPWPFYVNNKEPFLKQFRSYLVSRFDTPLEQPDCISPAMWSIITKSVNQNHRVRQGDSRILRADLDRFLKYGIGVDADGQSQSTVLASLDSLAADTAPQSDYVEEYLETNALIAASSATLKAVTGQNLKPQVTAPQMDGIGQEAAPSDPLQLSVWTPLAVGLLYSAVWLILAWLLI